MTKTLLITLLFFALAGFAFFLACDSGGSGSGDSDTVDIDGLLEECNSLYTKYAICAWSCDFGGLCIEGCVDAWYGDFLDCCDQFDTDTACLDSCLAEVEGCYDECGPFEHDKRYECFRSFTDCEAACPPPIATDIPEDEYEDRFDED
jgi:hypothetical protein